MKRVFRALADSPTELIPNNARSRLPPHFPNSNNPVVSHYILLQCLVAATEPTVPPVVLSAKVLHRLDVACSIVVNRPWSSKLAHGGSSGAPAPAQPPLSKPKQMMMRQINVACECHCHN